MNQKFLFQYIFEMLDYGDEISKLIQPDGRDNDSYFMTLVYIERILDNYGRGLVRQSARAVGYDDQQVNALVSEANVRMDILRKAIRAYSQMYNFDDSLKTWGEGMYRDWHKLPDDHPNASNGGI